MTEPEQKTTPENGVNVSMEHIVEVARRTILEQGAIYPTVAIQVAGKLTASTLGGFEEEQPDRVQQMLALGRELRQRLPAGNLEKASFVTETWISTNTEGNFLEVVYVALFDGITDLIEVQVLEIKRADGVGEIMAVQRLDEETQPAIFKQELASFGELVRAFVQGAT